MPFLFLGIILIILGIFFFRMGRRTHNHDFELGSVGLLIGGIILIVFYGLFYRTLTLY